MSAPNVGLVEGGTPIYVEVSLLTYVPLTPEAEDLLGQ
jgi:hypothetical protein